MFLQIAKFGVDTAEDEPRKQSGKETIEMPVLLMAGSAYSRRRPRSVDAFGALPTVGGWGRVALQASRVNNNIRSSQKEIISIY